MKNLICLIVLLSSYLVGAQNLGVFVQGNTGTVLASNPQRPSDGQFAYSMEEGFGSGVSYQLEINRLLSLDYRLGYSQRGFSGATVREESYSTPEPNGPVTFRYVTFEQVMKLFILQDELYGFWGLRNERLLKHDLPDEWENPNGSSVEDHISSEYLRNWNFAGMVGVGYRYDRLFFEAGFSPTITPLLENANSALRNNFLFANIGFRVL